MVNKSQHQHKCARATVFSGCPAAGRRERRVCCMHPITIRSPCQAWTTVTEAGLNVLVGFMGPMHGSLFRGINERNQRRFRQARLVLASSEQVLQESSWVLSPRLVVGLGLQKMFCRTQNKTTYSNTRKEYTTTYIITYHVHIYRYTYMYM